MTYNRFDAVNFMELKGWKLPFRIKNILKKKRDAPFMMCYRILEGQPCYAHRHGNQIKKIARTNCSGN